MSDEQTESIIGNDDYIADQNQVVQGRVEKMREFAEQGIQPYANGYKPTHIAAPLHRDYGEMEKEALAEKNVEVSVAGRIMAMRLFGKAAFINVKDRSGEIQVHVRKDALGDELYAAFKKFDVGDIIGVAGSLFFTRTGELTISAQSMQLLTKSLRPLPEKWHGLTDVETRFRQRYVDTIVNDDVRKLFKTRSRIISFIRNFLEGHDFLEVETPMMHQTPGGATAKPFVTHHNALDTDLFLRIAPELYLKRLLVGGFERVYEVNRNFRNEGLSRKHNPEFTMLEFYWAYATFEDLMNLTEEMIGGLAEHILDSTTVTWEDHEISFERPWKRLKVRDAVAEVTDTPVEALDDRSTLEALAGKLPDSLSPDAITSMDQGNLLLEIFEQLVEPTLISPTFVYEYPASSSPLSRRNDEDPQWVDRFELVIAGMELANAFSELNDPLDQRQRFLDQLAAQQAGDEEAHPMDEDYIRALEYGMPPAAGEGIGIDRLVMLLTGAESIREVILFPQLRPES